MAYETRPNTGSLFKNDKKETDSHPDYKGSALIDGLGECWLDAWINESSSGVKYMSLKFKAKDAVTTRPAPTHTAMADDLDDGVPF